MGTNCQPTKMKKVQRPHFTYCKRNFFVLIIYIQLHTYGVDIMYHKTNRDLPTDPSQWSKQWPLRRTNSYKGYACYTHTVYVHNCMRTGQANQTLHSTVCAPFARHPDPLLQHLLALFNGLTEALSSCPIHCTPTQKVRMYVQHMHRITVSDTEIHKLKWEFKGGI